MKPFLPPKSQLRAEATTGRVALKYLNFEQEQRSHRTSTRRSTLPTGTGATSLAELGVTAAGGAWLRAKSLEPRDTSNGDQWRHLERLP